MPKLEHLWVQVAGLCMIVQHDKRVYVLMPSMNHHDHVHCTFLHVSKRFTAKDTLLGISRKAIELPLTSNGVEQPMEHVLEVSKETDQSPVKVNGLAANPVFGDLDARVSLPLATEPFRALGETAILTLRYSDGTPEKQVTSHGRIGVKIDLDDGPDELKIPGTGITLVPDAGGNVEITILNVRPKDLGRPPELKEPDEHLHHIDSYWALLDLKKKPPMVHAPMSGIPGEPKIPGDMKCSEAKYVEFPRWGAEFPDGELMEVLSSGGSGPFFSMMSIDPYNCTVGGGCPTGDC
jgi:hypothetical protein